MKARVICISRALAAGGQNVARAVSQRLGFRYVDEDIVKEAADREKVDVSVIEDAELHAVERVEERQRPLQRGRDRLAPVICQLQPRGPSQHGQIGSLDRPVLAAHLPLPDLVLDRDSRCAPGAG